jgi:hypothetical protein
MTKRNKACFAISPWFADGTAGLNRLVKVSSTIVDG